MAVAPRPIKCGAALADGTEYQEFTTVTRAQYVYDQSPIVGGPKQYTLREIHYQAHCPACGERKISRSRLLLRSLNFRELTFHIRFHPVATVNNRESHKHCQSAYVSHSADFTGLGFHPVASLQLHSSLSHKSRRCRT